MTTASRQITETSLAYPSWLARALSFASRYAVLGSVVLVAMFLRLYRFELMGWIPDNYEQMLATRRLVNGEFPLSQIYAPGIAIIMAPLYAVLPQGLGTMQLVVTSAGIALAPMAYFACVRLTGDRLAAAFVAFAIALDPLLVYQSRDSHYDALVTFMIAACLFAVPLMRGRSALWFVGYGLVLSLLINIRPSNAACLPALVLYWHLLRGGAFDPRSIVRALLSREVIAAFVTLVALSVLYAALGGWLGAATSRPSLESYGFNLSFYIQTMFFEAPGLLFVPVLAVVGATRLLRLNRPLALAIIFVVVAWPLVHAPFPWVSVRYMLPARMFIWYLAGFGVVELVARTRGLGMWPRVGARAYLAIAVVSLCALFLVPSGMLLNRWPTIAAQSDEGLFRELRPLVAEYEPDSLVISAMTRGMRDANPRVEYLDLIDYWFASGGATKSSTDGLAREIDARLATGKPVYYIYSRMEAGSDFSDGRNGFRFYYESVADGFRLSEVYRTERTNLDKHAWVVYTVSRGDPPATQP